MRPPKRQRRNPKPKCIGSAPGGIDLKQVAEAATYVGSTYHKDIPSFAGLVPHPRPNANCCPRDFAWKRELIAKWLREAILAGWFGELWEGRFPRYVWIRKEGVTYEARGNAAGEYHGYLLDEDQPVRGLP